MQVEDGTGQGYKAQVNAENRLVTFAVTETLEHHINSSDGLSFNLLFQQTPTGANDCFLYIKNTDDMLLTVEGIWIRAASNDTIEVKLNDIEGSVVGHSEATPVNLNAGSGKSASGTFRTGNDITGLSGGTISERVYVASGNASILISFAQNLVVPKNFIISFYAVTGTAEIDGTLIFHYADPT
ncbi:hypothetical protein LCGC14_1271630 [marine sediment metagenome]|uniref:Uncharacterized protein n=1 Tax=marine sediment metagenome TaxID=412755 RepID=A0A0F9NEJ8_9ZZZZ